MSIIYATKQKAIEAAVAWVQADTLGATTLWQRVPSNDDRNRTPEAYIVTQVHSDHLGWIYIQMSANGLNGTVTARKVSAQEVGTFPWRDEGEYVRLRRIARAKAYSARQDKLAIHPSAQPKLFNKTALKRAGVERKSVARPQLERSNQRGSGSAPKMQFILHSELATASERLAAERWLRAHGWNDRQIQSAKKHGVIR